MIESYVGTRSATQVRSHAQKYDLKVCKSKSEPRRDATGPANVRQRDQSVEERKSPAGLCGSNASNPSEDRINELVLAAVTREENVECELGKRAAELVRCIEVLQVRVNQLETMKDVSRLFTELEVVVLSLRSIKEDTRTSTRTSMITGSN